MKRCVLFRLGCAQKKNNTTTINVSILDKKKERNNRLFIIESKKRNAFDHKKRNVGITSSEHSSAR
jgi:hypothetical protein